jgi:hypothetical protein
MFPTQRHDHRVRRQAGLLLEFLDDRLALSAGARGAAAEAVLHDHPADHTQLNHLSRRPEILGRGSPAAVPANLSAALRSLFREYEDWGGGSRFAPSLPGRRPLQIRGSRVAVRIKVAFPSVLGAYLRELRADGLQILRTMPAYGMAEGMLPIGKLPAVAQLAAHVWPAHPPIMR